MDKIYLNNFRDDSFDIFQEREDAIGAGIDDAFRDLKKLTTEEGKEHIKNNSDLHALSGEIRSAAKKLIKATNGDYVVTYNKES